MLNYKKLIKTATEPLSDKDYLSQYITDMHLFKANETFFLLNNVNSELIEITRTGLQQSDLKNAIGKNYSGFVKDEADAARYYHQDRIINQTKLPIRLLHINDFQGLESIDCTRSIIINPWTKNAVGISCHRATCEIKPILKTMLSIHKIRFNKQSELAVIHFQSKFELTTIERSVLFCICLGITNRKDIADFLSKIYRKPINHETTIGDAIRRLYRKLNCNTHYQLIEFAVYNNMHLEIPQAFLPTGSYLIR